MSGLEGDASLWGLFLSGFISATLLPGGSEALFSWMIYQDNQPALPLFMAVTTGNALGGIVTFGMGWMLALRYPLKTLENPRHQQAKRWLEEWGPIALLLSWVPIIGDPLCFIAGWLRGNILLAALMITLGKAARYLALMLLVG